VVTLGRFRVVLLERFEGALGLLAGGEQVLPRSAISVVAEAGSGEEAVRLPGRQSASKLVAHRISPCSLRGVAAVVLIDRALLGAFTIEPRFR
jgi:hypothetical protein